MSNSYVSETVEQLKK